MCDGRQEGRKEKALFPSLTDCAEGFSFLFCADLFWGLTEK